MDFLQIFSSDAEKARLLTTLISTGVALFVVFVVHRLTRIRARNEFMALKTEKAYHLTRKVRTLGMALIKAQLEKQPLDSSAFAKYKETFEELELITFLYIPKIEKYVEGMNFAIIACREDKEFLFQSSLYSEYDSFSAFLLTQATHCRNELKKNIKQHI